jgi:hypothetical protein
MTPSESLVVRLVDEFPDLARVMEEHLVDQEGELLPYLFLADVARWAQATYRTAPDTVGRLADRLEAEFEAGEPAERDLVALGFVEVIPFPPEGAPLLLRLGTNLTRVAEELGMFQARS